MKKYVGHCAVLLAASTALIGCAAPTNDDDEQTDSTSQELQDAWFLLRNEGSKLCLDGYNGGGNIHPYMYRCSGKNPYQRWYRTGSKFEKICNVGTARCLDGFVSASGGNPYLYPGGGWNPYQAWTASSQYSGLFSAVYLTNGGNGACLDGFGALGARPYLYACANKGGGSNAYQQWGVVKSTEAFIFGG